MARGDMRRMGIWGANGWNSDPDLMFQMKPATLTVIWEHAQGNRVEEYLQRFPDGRLHVRFMHPTNWHENPAESARNFAAELLNKLSQVDEWGASWVFWNELNLYNENGWGGDRQQYCETPEFYQRVADWTYQVIDRVKQVRPDTRAILPPFAIGHNEDGAPIAGVPQAGWAGYDYFADMVHTHFGDEIDMHLYWGDGSGANQHWLYDDELADWYAFRWRKVSELFAVRYNNPNVKFTISECGNFHPTLPTYAQDLIYYAEQSLKDERVSGITVFLWDDPTHANDINNLHKIQDLRGFVNQLAAAPDVEITDPMPPDGGNKMYWKDFEDRAVKHYKETGEPLNEAAEYGVSIDRTPIETGKKKLRCIGVMHLSCEDNHGMHNLFADALDDAGYRLSGYLLEYRHADGSVTHSQIDKPPTEPGTNIPLFKDDLVSTRVLSVDNEFPSDIVTGFGTDHADECTGNTRFHHSFFVFWQVVEDKEDPAPPDPPPSQVGLTCKVLTFLRNVIDDMRLFFCRG